jgi:beta-fructofuranosidase
VLLFSCDSQALAGAKAGDEGGIWSLVVDAELGPFAVEAATLLTSGELYSGRVIQNRAGDWVLLAFENMSRDGEFGGSITDPIAVEWAGPTQMALGASEVGA